MFRSSSGLCYCDRVNTERRLLTGHAQRPAHGSAGRGARAGHLIAMWLVPVALAAGGFAPHASLAKDVVNPPRQAVESQCANAPEEIEQESERAPMGAGESAQQLREAAERGEAVAQHNLVRRFQIDVSLLGPHCTDRADARGGSRAAHPHGATLVCATGNRASLEC